MKKVAMIAGLLTAMRRFGVILAVTGIAAAGIARPAAAQLAQGFLTGAERDSDGQNMVLVGGWLSGPGPGWSAVAGVIGYRLEVPVDGGSTVAWAANPFLGVRRQWTDGGVQANVGYSFRQTDDETADQPSQRISSGLTTGAQLDWGLAGPIGAQVIAQYSWDDSGYLWSRLRTSARVHRSQGGAELRLGADATAQGDDVYHAYELGPILEWRALPGLALVAGGGLRRSEVDGAQANDLTYFRVELVFVR